MSKQTKCIWEDCETLVGKQSKTGKCQPHSLVAAKCLFGGCQTNVAASRPNKRASGFCREHRYQSPEYREYAKTEAFVESRDDRWLQSKYGISFKDYKRMLQCQDNSCAICKQPFDKKPHVDHNHQTGEVRGLLCQGCNWGLGHFKDSVKRMLSAVEYLETRGGAA